MAHATVGYDIEPRTYCSGNPSPRDPDLVEKTPPMTYACAGGSARASLELTLNEPWAIVLTLLLNNPRVSGLGLRVYTPSIPLNNRSRSFIYNSVYNPPLRNVDSSTYKPHVLQFYQ